MKLLFQYVLYSLIVAKVCNLYVDSEDLWRMVGFVVSEFKIIESGGGRIRSLGLINSKVKSKVRCSNLT